MYNWIQEQKHPIVKPRWAWPQAQYQALTLSSIDKSLSPNRQRVWGPGPAGVHLKKAKLVANLDWVDNQAFSLLQYINVKTKPSVLFVGHRQLMQTQIKSGV